MLKEKTGGKMKTITITNEAGQVVVKLYFTADGKLHGDSWLKPEA